ncbi:MAG: hypothetical protein IKV99_00305 [Oscillospiraceae bacterium]|nr:hypothetical protein [Oscillospiraceae bacterium]
MNPPVFLLRKNPAPFDKGAFGLCPEGAAINSRRAAARRAAARFLLRHAAARFLLRRAAKPTKNHQEEEKFSTHMGKRVTTAVTKMTIRLQKWKKP